MSQETIDWETELSKRSIAQSELAERAGLSPRTVNRVIRGERQGWPSTRRRMTEALRDFPPILVEPPRPGGLRGEHES
jgi:transcriptional regulator with XRE-family HTH domain